MNDCKRLIAELLTRPERRPIEAQMRPSEVLKHGLSCGVKVKGRRSRDRTVRGSVRPEEAFQAQAAWTQEDPSTSHLCG